jgi:hypothetical protein
MGVSFKLKRLIDNGSPDCHEVSQRGQITDDVPDRVTLKSCPEQPIDNLGYLRDGNDSLETVAYRQKRRPAKANQASTGRQ